jgi:hypothetical protein
MITNSALLRSLQELHAKADILMSQQDDLTAAATAIQAENADLASAAANISAEIAALKAANPALDLTALDAAVAGIPAAQAGVDALETPPAV